MTQFFSTTKGGGEYLFKIISNTLAQKGHKVWIVTNNVKGESYEESENLKIVTVKPTLQYKGGLPPTFLDNIRYVINAFRVGRVIAKSQKIDLIHSNNFSPALAGSLISYFLKTPHIITIFDIFSQNGKDFWKKWIKQTDVSKINAMLVPWFEKLLVRIKHDAIYTISDRSKKDIEEINAKKPIYNIPPAIKEEDSLDENTNVLQFMYIGRLVFYKNVEVILKAFKIVADDFPNAVLVIAGDGPNKESLLDLTRELDITQNVRFEGYVTSDEKKKMLAESNALLFPSLVEGFGLVMLEAFQQKKPVLVSNIAPMSEIIENNKTGILIDPHNEKEWAQNIIKLIKSPDESKKMGNEGEKTLKEKYSQKLLYDRIIKMYNEISKNDL